MSLDTEWFWAFLVAFVRASGVALVAPVFGSRLVPARGADADSGEQGVRAAGWSLQCGA